MRENPVVIWGSGKQTRDFIHVSDIVGATLALVASGTDGYRAVNLGSGVATSFTEVAVIASQYVGYSPEFQTDDTKPEGVASRFSDPTLMLSVYQPKVSLEAGIARMVDRYTST
jgi:nucleoside-diphosphate-sugar epimerase